MDAQQCYVCGKHFDDKVKLGLHLTPCYNEAVGVRKELWHPHPLDLVDEQRYTEYMRGKFLQNEEKIRAARQQNVSFVTADNFEAMRGTLGPVRHKAGTPQKQQRGGGGEESPQRRIPQPPPPAQPVQPVSPTRQQAPQQLQQPQRQGQQTHIDWPPVPQTTHSAQVAMPVRQVVTGVTMLRNELSDEISKLRELREAEERNANIRQECFQNLLQNVAQLSPGYVGGGAVVSVTGSAGTPQYAPPVAAQCAPSSAPPPAPTQLQMQAIPPPQGASAGIRSAVPYGPEPARAPSRSPPRVEKTLYESTQQASFQHPEAMPDGRLRCPTCGKLFGKKGFEVHAQRCFRGAEDFTFSRDARFENNHPAPNQPVPQLTDERYAPTVGQGGANPEDAWTQFMITYPRPVLDEKPKTAKERNKAAADAKQKAEFAQMMQREMNPSSSPQAQEQREPTVPCGKCGRFFYESRAAKHEATCVAKPKK
jgi:hypothetical protein